MALHAARRSPCMRVHRKQSHSCLCGRLASPTDIINGFLTHRTSRQVPFFSHMIQQNVFYTRKASDAFLSIRSARHNLGTASTLYSPRRVLRRPLRSIYVSFNRVLEYAVVRPAAPTRSCWASERERQDFVPMHLPNCEISGSQAGFLVGPALADWRRDVSLSPRMLFPPSAPSDNALEVGLGIGHVFGSGLIAVGWRRGYEQCRSCRSWPETQSQRECVRSIIHIPPNTILHGGKDAHSEPENGPFIWQALMQFIRRV